MDRLVFPAHKAGLYLTHNEHKSCYETLEYRLSCYPDWLSDWVSEEQKKKALETQELWELQWYPDTPIGSYHIIGADLDAVLQRALEIEKEYLSEMAS